MEEPRSPRALERLAGLRAQKVAEERRALEAAMGALAARRAERDAAKVAQREAERRAAFAVTRLPGEGSQAALEALMIGLRRVEEARVKVRAAKSEVALIQERLERERAQERAARQLAEERAAAVRSWRLAREQDQMEETFRAASFHAT